MAIHRGILTAQLILYDEVLCKNSYPLSTVIYFRNPVSIDLLKVNNRNTSIRCEICSNLTIKTPERRHWHRSGIFIVNSELISHLVLVFLLLTLEKYLAAGKKLHPSYMFDRALNSLQILCETDIMAES